jgi:hypothetical protein
MNDLFIGGGGYSGFTFIGALEYIHQKELLDLKNFYGTSIGALIGVLYISGTHPRCMINLFQKINIEEIIKYDFTNIHNGFIDDLFLDTLIKIVTDKYENPDICLREFSEKTNVNVNIYATHLAKNEYTCFNNISYPEVRLKDALKASMSIPFLFKPVEINNELYADGCCKNLAGSPPKEIYICGYSIILTPTTNTYMYQVIRSIFTKTYPNSTFIININNPIDPNVYFNLNTLKSKFIIDMYKKGIESAKLNLE